MQLSEEDSPAKVRERHFLHVASSSCKAVPWLLLNARKSRMCQAHAARERGMNQPKDPHRWQQVAAGLLLPIGCHTVLITGQQMLSELAAGAVRGTDSSKT